MMRIGIVGHRSMRGAKVTEFVAQQCTNILKEAQNKYPGLVALSAIAEGADTIFAEAALGLGIPLEIVQPYNTYSSDFTTASARDCYYRLFTAARSVTTLAYTHRSNKAYEAAMYWIVMRSGLLVAAWDGGRVFYRGGTAHAVSQAIRTHRPWIHVNVVELSVTHHIRAATINHHYEGTHGYAEEQPTCE